MRYLRKLDKICDLLKGEYASTELSDTYNSDRIAHTFSSLRILLGSSFMSTRDEARAPKKLASSS